jgi:type II secretory pathway pseudopilin PulG
MERIALHSKNGMTLIEVLLALVILMIVSLAVMQTALVAMNANLQNSLRDEAVNIVDMRVNELRSAATGTQFDGGDLATPSNPTITNETPISRSFRAFSVNYTPTRTVSSINTDTKQVTMSVAWLFRGRNYTHSVTTIMRRQ